MSARNLSINYKIHETSWNKKRLNARLCQAFYCFICNEIIQINSARLYECLGGV